MIDMPFIVELIVQLMAGLVRSSSVYKISLGRGYWGLTYAIHQSGSPTYFGKQVGRTNPLRAAFFSSGASGAKNVAFTPPYNIHNWIPLHVTWPRASPKLLKFNSSRSYGRFRCASSLSTRAHYTYLQYFSQFSARICDQRSFRTAVLKHKS